MISKNIKRKITIMQEILPKLITIALVIEIIGLILTNLFNPYNFIYLERHL